MQVHQVQLGVRSTRSLHRTDAPDSRRMASDLETLRTFWEALRVHGLHET
jgi:hypothetical protein